MIMKGGIMKEKTILINGETMPYEQYLAYMSNPSHICECENCPENRGRGDDRNNYRECGQQNCWVRLHCENGRA